MSDDNRAITIIVITICITLLLLVSKCTTNEEHSQIVKKERYEIELSCRSDAVMYGLSPSEAVDICGRE